MISAAKADLLVTLDLSPLKTVSELQCAVWDHAAGEWMLSQALRRGAREDTRILRYSPTGELLDTCTLVGAGHGSSFVSDGHRLTVGWDRAGGRDLMEVDYQPGRQVPRSSARKFAAAVKTYAVPLCATSATGGTRRVSSSSVQTFTMHHRAGRFGPLERDAAATVTLPILSGSYQGAAATRRYLFSVYGKTNRPALILQHDWTTGKRVDRLNVTGLGPLEGERWSSVEHEGLSIRNGRLCLGVRLGPLKPKTRKFRVYQLTF